MMPRLPASLCRPENGRVSDDEKGHSAPDSASRELKLDRISDATQQS